MASLFARITGWTSGARRRDQVQPSTRLTVGDPVQLVTTQSLQQWSLTARDWRPAAVGTRRVDYPESFWGTYDVGLLKTQRTASPKISTSLINPKNAPAEITEGVSGSPEFVAPANQVPSYPYNPEEPPPPPKPGSTWDGHTAAWWKRPLPVRA